MTETDQKDQYDYNYICKIGGGGCGTVHLYWKTDIQKFRVIKFIRVSSEQTDRILHYFNRESKISIESNHPAILKTFDCHLRIHDGIEIPVNQIEINQYEEYSPYIEMEYLPAASLEDKYCSDEIPFISVHTLVIAYGVASALQYLHSKKIIHRDVKPSNILLGRTTKNYSEPFLSDFGFSRKVKNNDIVESKPGTPLFAAPELYHSENESYDHRIDIYAYGMTLYYLSQGNFPLSNEGKYHSLIQKIVDGIPSKEAEKLYKEKNVKEMKLISACLNSDPNKRPLHSDILHEIVELSKDLSEEDQALFQEYKEKVDKNERRQENSTEVTVENIAAAADELIPEGILVQGMIQYYGYGVEKDICQCLCSFNFLYEQHLEDDSYTPFYYIARRLGRQIVETEKIDPFDASLASLTSFIDLLKNS